MYKDNGSVRFPFRYIFLVSHMLLLHTTLYKTIFTRINNKAWSSRKDKNSFLGKVFSLTIRIHSCVCVCDAYSLKCRAPSENFHHNSKSIEKLLCAHYASSEKLLQISHRAPPKFQRRTPKILLIAAVKTNLKS